MPVDPSAMWAQRSSPPLILSLSGGGFRSYFTAKVLAKIEELLQVRCCDIFDLFAGTSIGGLIAIGLAQGAPAADIASIIHDHGPGIFPSLGFRAVRRFFGPPYRSTGIAHAFAKILPGRSNTPLGSTTHRVMVVAASPVTARLVVLCSWDKDGTAAISNLDAALATSAAPTYFPTYRARLNRDGSAVDLIDGGVAANAPDALAIHHAVSILGFPEDRIAMLSIGTCGETPGAPGTANPNVFGYYGALRRLGGRGIISLMMAIQEERGISEARARLGANRYLRIDEAPAPEQAKFLKLDNASPVARQTLTELADRAGQRLESLSSDFVWRHMFARSQLALSRPLPI